MQLQKYPVEVNQGYEQILFPNALVAEVWSPKVSSKENRQTNHEETGNIRQLKWQTDMLLSYCGVQILGRPPMPGYGTSL